EDELETFKLLKPAFMEKLIGLKQYYKKISFGFIGKKLVIAINNGKDSFDIQLFKPLNEQFIDEIKKELMDLKDIIALLVVYFYFTVNENYSTNSAMKSKKNSWI